VNAQTSRDEKLFAAALVRPEQERAAFLDGACGGDAALRERIVALLKAHAGPDSLLAGGPVQAAMSVIGSQENAGDVIGHYKLRQKIGEGGCGIVWMAEQEEPVRRRVALKIIKLGMDTKAVVARFEAERQALAMMDHPNIAKVHDAGATETGRPFFVMELVRGIPITKHCDENHLTPTDRLELFIKVCQAIQHAHQKGIIHRDIKPSNILVTVNDGAPTPKVIDFGIAKATQGRLTDATVFTQFEQFIGTPVYMSPEQAEMSSLDIDTRSDIYSLGVLLYELLTGRPPFDPKKFAQEGVDQIRREIREIEPPRPSARLHTLDEDERTTIARLRNTAASELAIILRGDLDWIVMRCIEKDRTRRYDTANGLAMDIQRYLRNEPVIARPPSTAYLLQKLVRRHRVGFAASVTVLGVVAAGAVVSTWQAVRATRAEQEQSRLRAAEAALRRQAEAQELTARQRAYAADMQLTQQALGMDHLVRARELLHRHKPQPGQRDLRGWEWRYLWQLCQSDVAAFLCEGRSTIRAVSTSRDGKWLATVQAPGNPRLSVWNMATRQETPMPDIPASGRAAFSPSGSLLAVSAFGRSALSPLTGNRIVVLDMQARRIVKEFRTGGPCGGLFFSEDGQMLVSSGQEPENKLTLWRIADGAILDQFDAPQPLDWQHGTPFAVTPDFRLAAHAAPDQTLRVIDLKTREERWQNVGATAGNAVISLAFSPDGTLLASAAAFGDDSIRLWDVNSGQLVRQLKAHHRWVPALLFWPDGKTMASASGDRTIRIWDVSNGTLLKTLRGHRLEAWRLALLPDQTTLVSGGKGGEVCLWDTAAEKESPWFTLPATIDTWRFAEDSRSILTIDGRGQVVRHGGRRFREAQTVMELGPVLGGIEMLPEQISPDLRFIAIQRAKGSDVEVWDTRARTLHRKFPAAGNTYPVAVFHDTHRVRVFAERNANTLVCREWDTRAEKETGSWRIPIRGSSDLIVAFPSDGKTCLVTGSSGGAVVYDLQTGEVKTAPVRNAGRFPQYSPDGSMVAAAIMGIHATELWETGTYRRVGSLSSIMGVPHSVAFSPDGRRLAIGGGDKESVTLWDVESREHLLKLDGSGTIYFRTAFSPDGNILSSRNIQWGRWDGILNVWVAPSWEEIDAAERAHAASIATP
jgi:eukaryotic-like serine/threonine-protein kinase